MSTTYFPRGPQDDHEHAALTGNTLPEGWKGMCIHVGDGGRHPCTLGLDHDGDHVAADEDTVYARWPQASAAGRA